MYLTVLRPCLLKLAPLSGLQFLIAIGIAMAAVLWYELVKLANRIYKAKKTVVSIIIEYYCRIIAID